MSQEIKNVIVIGAGGSLGPHIVRAIDNDPHLTVSILSRKSSKSTFPSHIQVHKVGDNYPEQDLLTAFNGQDAAVCLVPPQEKETTKAIIDAAAKAGVKRFLPCEFASDTDNPKVVEAVPVFGGKVEIANHLRSKEKEGMSWTGLVDGGFLDWGIKTGFLGFNLAAKTAILYNAGTPLSDYTLLSTIGLAVAAILTHPAQTANKYIYVNEQRCSQLDLLAALEKATSTKWTIEHATGEETAKKGWALLQKGDAAGVDEIIKAGFFSGGEGIDYSKNRELANEMLGLPKPEDLETVVKKIVDGVEV